MKFFYNAQSFCDHLAKLFKRVTPIAGKGILIEDTDNGKRISCTIEPVNRGSGSAPTDEYKGYFAIVYDDELECYVCGNNNGIIVPGSSTAGWVYFGYYTRLVLAIGGIQTGEYVWLECSYNGTDYVGELKHGLDADVPEGTPDLNVQIVGYVTNDDIPIQVQKGIYDLRFLLM